MNSIAQHQQQHHHEEEGTTLVNPQTQGDHDSEDWVESVWGVAKTAKKFLAGSACHVCQVYVDEQLEFERKQQQHDFNTNRGNSNVHRAWLKAVDQPLEVELYRQFLFDEDSVVHSIERSYSKEENEDEHRTIMTQRSS
jgi:hypothetical protein